MQLAAVAGEDRLKRAEEYVKELAAKGIRDAVVGGDDGKHVRVFAGPYPDRATADKRCKELKQTKDFSGCFVKAL